MEFTSESKNPSAQNAANEARRGVGMANKSQFGHGLKTECQKVPLTRPVTVAEGDYPDGEKIWKFDYNGDKAIVTADNEDDAVDFAVDQLNEQYGIGEDNDDVFASEVDANFLVLEGVFTGEEDDEDKWVPVLKGPPTDDEQLNASAAAAATLSPAALVAAGREAQALAESEFTLDQIDAELNDLDDNTRAGAALMFDLAATAVKVLARDSYPTAASVVLEDINDDDGYPYFVVVAIKDAAGEDLWTSGDDDETDDAFAEYAPMLDRNLSKLEVVDRRQGLSKLTF